MQGGHILAPEVGRIFRSETLSIHDWEGQDSVSLLCGDR
jgi:hypothetical protein